MTVKQQLLAACAAFDNAFNQKQLLNIQALYATDAVVLPAPAGEALVGQQAITSFFGGLMDAGVTEHQLRMDQLVHDDRLAVFSGKWSAAMVSTEGEKQQFGGNVQLVYQQQPDGQWLTISHLWN